MPMRQMSRRSATPRGATGSRESRLAARLSRAALLNGKHRTDVPLSATRTSVSMDAGRTLLPYVPAHPARGTDAHRMTLVLVSQEARLASPPAAPVREGFSLAAWLEQAGGEAVGLAFWRSKWAEADAAAVSQVWREYRKGEWRRAPSPRCARCSHGGIAGEAEPAYGKAPRRSEYQAVDGSLPSRYF